MTNKIAHAVGRELAIADLEWRGCSVGRPVFPSRTPPYDFVLAVQDPLRVQVKVGSINDDGSVTLTRERRDARADIIAVVDLREFGPLRKFQVRYMPKTKSLPAALASAEATPRKQRSRTLTPGA